MAGFAPKYLLRKQRAQACAVSQTRRGLVLGRCHKESKATCRHEVLLRLSIQRMVARWHCAARREIAERSEEAPGAEAAQPSRNVGKGKAPAGCFGGDARGAEKGAQPHNRPRLALAGGGPNEINEKPPCPQGTESTSQRTSPVLITLEHLPRESPPCRPSRMPCPQPRRRPKRNKRKAPVPAGHKSHLSKDRLCFIFFRAPTRSPHASKVLSTYLKDQYQSSGPSSQRAFS